MEGERGEEKRECRRMRGRRGCPVGRITFVARSSTAEHFPTTGPRDDDRYSYSGVGPRKTLCFCLPPLDEGHRHRSPVAPPGHTAQWFRLGHCATICFRRPLRALQFDMGVNQFEGVPVRNNFAFLSASPTKQMVIMYLLPYGLSKIVNLVFA